jgi:hypothetical protein
MRMKLGAAVENIELGATVWSADRDEVGKIDQLIIDSQTQTILSFILQTGRFHNHDYVVPIETIARQDADHALDLVFTAAQLRAMPEFEEQNFVTVSHSHGTGRHRPFGAPHHARRRDPGI